MKPTHFYLLASLYFVVGMLPFLSLFAQKHDNVWVFAINRKIDFSRSPLTTDSIFCPQRGLESVASVSDKDGNLVCYLDARIGSDSLTRRIKSAFLRNSLGIVIENGDSIYTNGSMTQALLLPGPKKEEQYFFFGLGTYFKVSGEPARLTYTIIDGKANAGNGKVIRKNIAISDSILGEKICAVRHGNGKDWWIAVNTYDKEEYHLYRLSENGIHSPIIQSFSEKEANYVLGQMAFSPTGDKLMVIGAKDRKTKIYAFNRCSGILQPITTLDKGYYGGAFSPDGSKVYIVHPILDGYEVYQYDISDTLKPKIGTIVGKIINRSPSSSEFTSCQLTPDDKIYILPLDNRYISIIHNPNSVNCTLQDSGIWVGSRFSANAYINGSALPNMPNYRLGAMRCPPDARPETVKNHYFEFYPNPAKENFTFRYLTNENFTLSICTTTGVEVMRYDLNQQGDRTIDVSDLSEGMYIVKAQAKGGILFTEKLVIVR